jgi:hypothetical protein
MVEPAKNGMRNNISEPLAAFVVYLLHYLGVRSSNLSERACKYSAFFDTRISLGTT